MLKQNTGNGGANGKNGKVQGGNGRAHARLEKYKYRGMTLVRSYPDFGLTEEEIRDRLKQYGTTCPVGWL